MNSADSLWEKDYEVFKHLDIMQSGFEEKKGGNPRVVASRELGANFAIRGADNLSPAEKEKYAEVWNKMYKRPALLRLLSYNCPDLATPTLKKAEIIHLLINNDISMPTMHHWVSIYSGPEMLPSISEYNESDDDNDPSKAVLHSKEQKQVRLPRKRKQVDQESDTAEDDTQAAEVHASGNQGRGQHTVEEEDTKLTQKRTRTVPAQRQNGERSNGTPLNTNESKYETTSVVGGANGSERQRQEMKFSENHPGKRKVVKNNWRNWKVGSALQRSDVQPTNENTLVEDQLDRSPSHSPSRSPSPGVSRQVRGQSRSGSPSPEGLLIEVDDGDGVERKAHHGQSGQRRNTSLPGQQPRATAVETAQKRIQPTEHKLVTMTEEELSKLVEESTKRGFRRGRKEMLTTEDEDLVCIFPDSMKKKALKGEFISMYEIFKCKLCYRKTHKKKSPVAKLKTLLNDEDDDEEVDGQLINWSQFKSLIPDLIFLYVVIGKHYKKAQMVLIYCRNLIHFGDFKCFTYESIITGDHEIRLRHQGPDFIWRIDSNAKHAWFIPYTHVNVSGVGRRDAARVKSSTSSSSLKVRGPCYRWLQGEKCDARQCKWNHRCNTCKGKEHVMDKCELRTTYLAKIKTLKAVKPKAL